MKVLSIMAMSAAFFAAALQSISCNDTGNMAGKDDARKRFIYNNDGTYVLGNALYGGRPLTIEDARSYVDIVAGTAITTYAICSNSLMPYYESRYERSIGCLGEGQEDTRKTSLGENVGKYGENLRRLREKGTDIIEICVNRAKELGMEAFVTMRMNDLHFTDTSVRNPLEQSDFWLLNPGLRVGAYPGWHADGALNFAEGKVREYKLNTIREICGRFDLDGLELDFMRFPVYFPHGKGEEYSGVMTDFVAQVRKIVEAAGGERGRRILLGARVPPDMNFCRTTGLDVRSWIDGNLIDMLTVSAFFSDNPLLPVREFRKVLGDISIPIYGSIDNGLYSPREPRSHGMYRAAAAHLYSGGIDGLYLFNYFFDDPKLMDTRKALPGSGEVICFSPDPALLADMADEKSLGGRNKLYTLGDNRVNEYGLKADSPTPVTLERGVGARLKLTLHEDFTEFSPTASLLLLRIQKGATMEVSLNGTALTADDGKKQARLFRRDIQLKDNEEMQAYNVPAKILKDGENELVMTLENLASALLVRVELTVGFGSPEQSGYY